MLSCHISTLPSLIFSLLNISILGLRDFFLKLRAKLSSGQTQTLKVMARPWVRGDRYDMALCCSTEKKGTLVTITPLIIYLCVCACVCGYVGVKADYLVLLTARLFPNIVLGC